MHVMERSRNETKAATDSLRSEKKVGRDITNHTIGGRTSQSKGCEPNIKKKNALTHTNTHTLTAYPLHRPLSTSSAVRRRGPVAGMHVFPAHGGALEPRGILVDAPVGQNASITIDAVTADCTAVRRSEHCGCRLMLLEPAHGEALRGVPLAAEAVHLLLEHGGVLLGHAAGHRAGLAGGEKDSTTTNEKKRVKHTEG